VESGLESPPGYTKLRIEPSATRRCGRKPIPRPAVGEPRVPGADVEHSFRSLERSPNADGSPASDNGPMIVFDEFETKTGGRLDTLDITREVRDMVASSGVRDGSVLVFSPHTTCCILIGAPGVQTARALAVIMEALAPSDGYYAHDDLAIRTENLTEDEPPNAPAHLFHVFAGKASESIPILAGRLLLGSDQRVFFVELDASRERRYAIQVIGE
jgi:secondary thiamine-phosphate synthase enzyme